MTLPEEITELLQQKSGLALHAPCDCKPLIDAIYAETGEILGLSTVKRLLGIFADTRSPRKSTLDIIARYLGSSDWDELLQDKCDSDSGFDPSLQHFDTSTLAEGTKLRICYHPKRVLELLHIQGVEFEVLSYNGDKLRAGDHVLIYQIVRGFPLFVKGVTRDGKYIGFYIAGRQNGVQEVVITPHVHA